MVSIRHGRRLAPLVAVATGIALWTLAAPASALTVTVPTLPSAPLPTLPLPTGASVSGGTGGTPIDVSVTGPGSTGVDLQLPGVPALPIGPTGPVTAPVEGVPPAVLTPTADTASPATPGGGAGNPSVAVPDDKTAVAMPASPFSAGAAPPAGPEGPASLSNVDASITARPADSLISRIPSIASRVALWTALAAVVFVLQMLVGSAVRQHRRTSVPVS